MLLRLLLCLFLLLPCAHADVLRIPVARHTLAVHYLAPPTPARGLLVFVHGDGPQPFDANGYYPLWWHTLNRQGYAIASWDKPGVGDSGGNWLRQSMSDRQREVRTVVRVLQKRYGIPAERTGLVGFSQAGWVVPALARDDTLIGFAIGIGFATNWRQQGDYFTRVRLARSGADEATIRKALSENQREYRLLATWPTHQRYVAAFGPIDPARLGFIMRNFEADASADYPAIRVPMLLLWGRDDANVDARYEYARRRQQQGITAMLLAGANHGLLDSEAFPNQLPGWRDWLKMLWLEDDALAANALPAVTGWLDARLR
ncbi:alpha/beta hydrolase family protein [Chitinibacteraceae bacterium HSL-7]